MCIKYYCHFHLSVPLLHATSGYIKSNFFGFRWAKWVVFLLVMQLNMLTDLITRCHETLPRAGEIQSFKVRSVSIASCFYDVWKPHTAFIFLNTFLGFCLVHGIEFVMNKSLSLVTFWLSFVETSFMFRVIIWSWHPIYFLMCFGEIIEDWKCWTPWVRSFGMIRIRISDPRSLGSW